MNAGYYPTRDEVACLNSGRKDFHSFRKDYFKFFRWKIHATCLENAQDRKLLCA